MPTFKPAPKIRTLMGALIAIAMVPTSQCANAQSPYFWIDWFSFLGGDWVVRYAEDDASPDGIRLTELPDEFGDSFAREGVLAISSGMTPDFTSQSGVVLAGGSRGLKVGEHNKAIPMNRVYLTYNHFHNAVDAFHQQPTGVPVAAVASNLDRYMLGAETRFGRGLWSAEVRMPFTAGYSFLAPGGDADYRAGEIGNLSLILKRLLYYDRCTSVVAGIGIEAPTGSNFTASINSLPPATYLISNDAVHLHPYVGILRSPNDCFFWHGFLQIDVPANGNGLTIDDITGRNAAGRYTDQTLMYLDLSAGYWLHRDECARLLTGIAGLLELHYTSALNNTDDLRGTAAVMAQTGPQAYSLSNRANRIDVLNLTAAAHFEFARTTSLRIGGVFPLTSGDDRFFDAEVSAQLIRRF